MTKVNTYTSTRKTNALVKSLKKLPSLNKLKSPFLHLNFGASDGDLLLATKPIIEFAYYGKDPQAYLELIDEAIAFLQTKFTKITSKNQQTTLPIGLYGYFSYEFGQQLYNINAHIINQAPLANWFLPQIIYQQTDQGTQKIKITLSDNDRKELTQLQEKLSTINTNRADHFQLPNRDQAKSKQTNTVLTPQISAQEYKTQLQKIFKLLKAGETYEVNFAQSFIGHPSKNPTTLYTKLNKLNPVEYSCLYQNHSYAIISNSPELLITRQNTELITEPIKGTIDIKENPQLILDDPKQNCELNMIIDLSRNDLAKISKPGTVKVEITRAIKKLKHLYQGYSRISAKAKPNLKTSEIIKSIFPGGSVTGCPKKRTMQIINNTEKLPRGNYCGSMGYIHYNQNLKLNILIRTLTNNSTSCYYHAGGAIIVDSDPESEYAETLLKTKTIQKALNQ